MKRLLISICGGLLLPLFLLVLLFPVGVIFGQTAMFLFAETVFWPFSIWLPVFPPPKCVSCNTSLEAIIASVITDFVAYALLTYLLQRPIEYMWRKWGLPMYERRSIDYTKIFSS